MDLRSRVESESLGPMRAGVDAGARPGLDPASTVLAGIQWLFFMFANTVVIPLSIGHAYHLAPAVITASLERSFMYTGVACILQATLGHRLPLMEGPSGLWWGVILSLAATAQSLGQSVQSIGGNLEVGIVISGVLIVLIGALGLGPWLRRLFGPVVTGAFFFSSPPSLS